MLDTNEWSTLGSIGGSGSRSERFGMGAMSTGVESGRATTVETAFAKSAATLAGVSGTVEDIVEGILRGLHKKQLTDYVATFETMTNAKRIMSEIL